MNPDIFLQFQYDSSMCLEQQRHQKNDEFYLFGTQLKKGQQILPAQSSTIIQSMYSKQKDSLSNKDSSKKQTSFLAGKKARERKKKYVQNLETQVKELQKKVLFYEQEIKKTKETLAQALNSTKNNQNSITYSQLQMSIETEDPNQDKINLLLDMIKFRIGAVGNERQAKIQYYFKQLMNTLFPALHRYLMYCSDKNLDVFQEHSIDEFFDDSESHKKDGYLAWTKEFIIGTLELSQKQRNDILKMKQRLIIKKGQVNKIIRSLRQIKAMIKAEQTIYEDIIDELRSNLSPVQSAFWVLLSDKYKYKREISLQSQIALFSSLQSSFQCTKKKRKLQ